MARVIRVAAGAFHIPEFLSASEQRRLVDTIRILGAERAGFYQPVLRSGARMRLRMMCVGRHWNARTYKYEQVRSDVDGLAVVAMPASLRRLAADVAAVAGMELAADVALINHYTNDGRLGLHQDKDERSATISSGIPVVSLSIGDTAEFLFGGSKRSDPVTKVLLASGDAFVFGGPSRLAYHGVRRVLSGTGAAALGINGRFNITFRQY